MSSCKLCASLGVNTKLQYNDALAKEHAQWHHRQLMSIFDQEITLDRIVENCFPKDTDSQIGAHRISSKYKLLVRVCRALFSQKPRSQSERTALCKKCDWDKTVYFTKGSFSLNTSRIIDHACSHLRLDLYECRECDRQFSNRAGMQRHLRKDHRLKVPVARLETTLDDFVDEISSMIKECFFVDRVDSSFVRRQQSSPRASDGLKLSDLGAMRQAFCRQLIKESCDQNGNVQCRLCTRGLKIKYKQKSCGSILLQHAFRHLQKPVVRCTICDDTFSNHQTLLHHLRKVHATTTANNYECREDPFHDDIMAVLRKCYSGETRNEADVANAGTPPPPSSVMSKAKTRDCKSTRGSKLQIERRMFCYGLCRKFANPNGEMKCRLCGKHCKAMNSKGYINAENILRHGITHMSHSALIRCKICSKTAVHPVYMFRHLRATHALPLANNYERLDDQFHHEILAVLSECYDDASTNAESAVE